MQRIIVTRFSAMGDVAMVASVLKEFQEQNQQTEVIMVSRSMFAGFFEDIPRVQFHVFEPKTRHKGLLGLWRLVKELKSYRAQYVADLHNNIRTRILNRLFRWSSKTVAVLDKGRDEKKELTRLKNKILKPLKPMTERYANVLRNLGFEVNLSHRLVVTDRPIPTSFESYFQTGKKRIGVAPFAQHPYKVLPMEKMKSVLQQLSDSDFDLFVFGGGNIESKIAENWSSDIRNVHSTIGKLNIPQELDLISNLDLMISMDSSGMHMASLVGTRCVSIWGATHPHLGFLGYGQSADDCIQVEHPNRPSSVYGNKPCDCDGIEAIDLVSVEMIVDKVKKICE